MARGPSYDFERRERQKAKDAKRAAKMQAKRESKSSEDGSAAELLPGQQIVDDTGAAIEADKVKKT